MKSQVYIMRIAGILILLFIFACNCKKVTYDYSGITLDQYYIAKINDEQELYIMFHRADSLFSGEYFIYKGKAVVTCYPFSGKTCKKKVKLNFQSPEGLTKTQGIISYEGSTIVYSYGKRRKSGEYRFVPEKPVKKIVIKPRYNTIAFRDVRKQEYTYGKARGYYTSKPVELIGTDEYATIIADVGKKLAGNILMSDQQLMLDLYQPVGDTLKKRPLLLVIHGGAFIIGDKDTETMRAIASYFAQRGYLVAVINYRLGYMFVPGGYVYLERCIYRAVQDARSALRYLVHYADEFRIDTNYIFISGNSAGGFTALKTAFMEQKEAFESASGNIMFMREDLGCLDCSGNDFKDKFRIRGVVNMWGALTDTTMISRRENIPVLLFHGNADEIVPPGHQYPFANVGTEFSSFFSHKTYGSVSIHEHMQRLGLKSRFVMFPGAGHDPQNGPDNRLNKNMNIILENMDEFLYGIISADSSMLNGKFLFGQRDDIAVYSLKGKGSLKAKWTIAGGKVISADDNGTRVKVVWFADAPEHTIECTVMNENGLVNQLRKEVVVE